MALELNYSNENLQKIIRQIISTVKANGNVSLEKIKAIIKQFPKRPRIISLEKFRELLKKAVPEEYDYWDKLSPKFRMTEVKYNKHTELISGILDKMIQIVMENYKTPLIHWAAKIILGTSNKTTEQNDLKEFYTLLLFLRDNIRYTRDMLDIETLIRPQIVLVKHASMDCDDFAITLASLLRTIGYRVRFKAIQAPGAKQIHHVYVEAFSPQVFSKIAIEKKNKGQKPDPTKDGWIALDGILKKKPLSFEPPYKTNMTREIR